MAFSSRSKTRAGPRWYGFRGRSFHHASFRDQIAAQDHQAARSFDRVGKRVNHVLSREFFRRQSASSSRVFMLAGHLPAMEQARIKKALRQQRSPAGVVQIDCRVFSPRFHVGQAKESSR